MVYPQGPINKYHLLHMGPCTANLHSRQQNGYTPNISATTNNPQVRSMNDSDDVRRNIQQAPHQGSSMNGPDVVTKNMQRTPQPISQQAQPNLFARTVTPKSCQPITTHRSSCQHLTTHEWSKNLYKKCELSIVVKK